MSSIADGIMEVQCDECNENIQIDSSDVDFEHTYGGDREMGPERCYTMEHQIECECGNEIEIVYEAWEYPERAFNFENADITGASLVSSFSFDFQGKPDVDEDI